MTDADKAYQIAEDRIARVKATGARVLSLSPHFAEDGKHDYKNTPDLKALDRLPPGIADLTDLQTLYLDGTQVEDISHLAAMTGMQTLDLDGTKVEDISHLAAMTGMQALTLYSTKVEDISHLAAMTGMRALHLSNTKVDLGQLVAEGAAWAEEDHALRDLEFRGTPAEQEGECLDGLVKAHGNNADRTKAALAALRAERDRRKVEGPAPVEPIEPPEQSSHLRVHISETGPDLAAAFPDDKELRNRVKQVCLEQLRGAAEKLALAAGNYHHDVADLARTLDRHLAPDLAGIDMLKAHLEIEWLIDHLDSADDLPDEDKPDAKELAALREIKRAGPGLTAGNKDVDELIASQKARDINNEPARDEDAEDAVMVSIRDDDGFWGSVSKGVAAFVFGTHDQGASAEARSVFARNAIIALTAWAASGVVGNLSTDAVKAAYEAAPLTGPIFDRALLWLSENAAAIRAVAATNGDAFAAWVSLILDDIRPYVAAIKDHAPRKGISGKNDP